MRNTDLALIIAAFLITNSHLKDFYPSPLLGGDGLLGVSLFFFLSGFGLALSARKTPRPFLAFYLRRVERIYPALILAALVLHFLLPAHWRDWDWQYYVGEFTYPTGYHFIKYIMVLYIPAFFFLTASPRTVGVAIALLVIPFVYFWFNPVGAELPQYGAGCTAMFWVWGLQQVLFGILLACYPAHLRSATIRRDWVLALLACGVYIAAKLAIKRFSLPSYCFMGVFLLLYPAIYLILRASAATDFLAFAKRHARLGAAGAFVAGLALEIYFVQEYLQYSAPIKNLRFPVNVLALFALTLAGAVVLQVAARAIVHLWSAKPRAGAARAPSDG